MPAGTVVTSVASRTDNTPLQYRLSQNYPNPFNPSTLISYELPRTQFVILRVYDVLGKEIATLVEQEQAAGAYQVSFDASGLKTGVYLYRLKAGGFTETKRLLFMK